MAIGTSPFTTTGYDNFVTNVDIKFLEEMDRTPSDMVRTMYVQQPWQDGDPKKITFDTYALPKYARRVDENEQFSQFTVQEGSTLDKTFFQFGGKYDYTLQMDKFDRLKLEDEFASNLAQSLRDGTDLELTHQIFTYADATTYSPHGRTYTVPYTTPDGLALASASHTVVATGATTYSNILSGGGALSVANLTALGRQMQKDTVDDKAINVDIWPDTLIVPNSFYMIKKAQELLGSPLTPETNNNAMNVYGAGSRMNMKLMVLNKGCFNTAGSYDTTKEYRWALFDSRYRKSFRYAMAGTPEILPKMVNNDNVLFSLLGYAFVAYGAPRWQGISYSLSTTQP